MPHGSYRSAALFLLPYAVCMVLLLGYQTPWVDEIMQFLGTRTGTLENTESLARSGVGGVPLGWIPQVISIRLLGYSVAAARLPSALAAVAACFVIFLIARRLSSAFPVIAVIFLAVLPLYFRYALEGRPYAQGLLVSSLAALVFLKLVDRQESTFWLAVYTVTLIAGIYSQPFSVFTGGAHLVWAVATGRRRLAWLTAAALVAMVASFLPWYLYAAPRWRETIQAGGFELHLGWKTPLMLLREISGAGYAGGILLALLAVLGLERGSSGFAMKTFLLACVAVPVAAVLMVDAVFHYFLAIRQMIFILPPLVLLAADGLTAVLRKPGRIAVATAALGLGCVAADVRWLIKPREDWGAAARAIARLERQQPACSVYAPASAFPYYALFEPGLEKSRCLSGAVRERAIIVVINPYTTKDEAAAARGSIPGRSVIRTESAGMSTLELWR